MKQRFGKISMLMAVGFLVLWAPCTGFAMDDKKAEETFKAFQEEWIRKLTSLGNYGPAFVKVEQDSDAGTYVARYRELGKPLASRIKKTDSKVCPYVGVFSYEEKVYASRGDSRKEAEAGPFAYEKTVKITEIFRISNGKWIY